MIKQWATIILILSSLNGCGKQVFKDDKTYIDEEIRPYFNSFMIEAKNRGYNISFKSSLKLSKISYAGFCYSDGSIDINIDLWPVLSDIERNWLVYHELGHCLLNLPHIDEDLNGCPDNIMNTFMFNPSLCLHQIEGRWDYLLLKLFGR